MELAIREANNAEFETVSEVLKEAARWLIARGEPLWVLDQLDPNLLEEERGLGAYVLAFADSEPAGVYRYQTEDSLFWPHAGPEEAGYLHRLSVRRRFAGIGIASAMVSHAEAETRKRSRRFLRLDCDSTRPKLRTHYEEMGFSLHSIRQIGRFSAARYQKDLIASG